MEENIGLKFMRATELKRLSPTDQMKGMEQPPLIKGRDRADYCLHLPDPEGLEVKSNDLIKAFTERRSIRSYADRPLVLPELAFLLWATQGVFRDLGQATLRTVPSAGARHALETYILVNRVEPLRPGLYRYQPLEHTLLIENEDPELRDHITAACLGQKMVEGSAVTFIWTAIPYRMNWRYGERGFRYLHLDAGHVGQNLYLAAEAVECGACAIGAYDDQEMNRILEVDGVEEMVIYMATVGKKEKEAGDD